MNNKKASINPTETAYIWMLLRDLCFKCDFVFKSYPISWEKRFFFCEWINEIFTCIPFYNNYCYVTFLFIAKII